MSPQLRITAPAARDIEEITDYLAEQLGMNRAEEFLLALDSKLARISKFPKIGRKRSKVLTNARSLAVENYLILYALDGQNIAVLRVVSGYRDLSALFDD